MKLSTIVLGILGLTGVVAASVSAPVVGTALLTVSAISAASGFKIVHKGEIYGANAKDVLGSTPIVDCAKELEKQLKENGQIKIIITTENDSLYKEAKVKIGSDTLTRNIPIAENTVVVQKNGNIHPASDPISYPEKCHGFEILYTNSALYLQSPNGKKKLESSKSTATFEGQLHSDL